MGCVYEYKPLEDELLGLELVRTGGIKNGLQVEKVDHRPKSSKDVADAAAGVAYSLETGIGKMEDVSIIAKRPNEPTEAEQYLEKVNAFEKGNYEKLYRIIEDSEDR